MKSVPAMCCTPRLIAAAAVMFSIFSTGFGQQFTMEQTLSDQAQATTIAFDGLAFITGSLGSDSFFPPGKVADFWGFQYLRDNDPSRMGHNTDFLTRASDNMLYVLTPSQRHQLVILANSQADQIDGYGLKRFVLMKAFRRLLEGNVPAGTTGLNREAVKAFSAELYRLDGRMCYERARVMGGILQILTAVQKSHLDSMVGKGMLTWPNVGEPSDLQGLSPRVKEAVMTYAGDMFSWYAGSVDADVYFCPERQATYFGSFYMKDAPAVGNPGYSIDTNATAGYGKKFLEAISPAASQLVSGLTDLQRPYLYELVDRRRDVSVLLRMFRAGQTPDSLQVLNLMDRYGRLDGEIIYHVATNFTIVNASLTSAQRDTLNAYRTALLGNLSHPAGAYLYATPIDMPDITNTDFLFTTATSPSYPVVGTGQTTCYNDSAAIVTPAPGQVYYGQDAQHLGNLPSYRDNHDGTITDLVTGLVWVGARGSKTTWASAAAGAATCTVGGYHDWRMPTIKELYSLIRFTGKSGLSAATSIPYIDTVYFGFAYGNTGAGERLIDCQDWSSTHYVGLTMTGDTTIFGVNFADGRIKGYPKYINTISGPMPNQLYVRYVRGTAGYGLNHFADNGDSTVTDQATGLMWSKTDSRAGMDWKNALIWVQSMNALEYHGHSDWRLPNAKELQSIVNYSRAPSVTGTPAIDTIFETTSILNEGSQTDYPYYWTSTTHLDNMGGVYISFGRGLGWMQFPPTYTWQLADVHGAGAQRSDPKSGDPAAYPHGLGPQGDVIRIENYVRLVRDAVGAVLPGKGSFGGTLFYDANQNGVQDPGEGGMAGWSVVLGTTPATTAVTGGDGSFRFSGLDSGSYIFHVTVRSGWTQTVPLPADSMAFVADSMTRVNVGMFRSSISVYRVRKGWNMLSLPKISEDRSVSELLPGASSKLYSYTGSYAAADSLESGTGYWIKFGSDGNVFLPGTVVEAETVQVHPGWNLLGPAGVPSEVGAIQSDSQGVVLSKFFGYTGRYVVADTLRPCEGYWVKSGITCRLMMGGHRGGALFPVNVVDMSEMPPPPPDVSGMQQGAAPAVYSLSHNYPNPFNGETMIRYQLPAASRVNVSVYNLLGQLVALLKDDVEPAGTYVIRWAAAGVSSGVYLLRMHAVNPVDNSGRFGQVRKMLLVK